MFNYVQMQERTKKIYSVDFQTHRKQRIENYATRISIAFKLFMHM